ncbi:hypothetical protein NM208_g7333 [Fusarium decemcellulare]|uniref:Uncharacterized protein n=1 Tax=Fusarium decemcellulare TaxID=57161 RepID=A0ACC1S9U9_9HYPO|nr:hypothetical protein NM208_g7333 [Fusarium decemcellulare]
MVVGAADEDARSQGYTFVSKTEFANMDDMKYYDDGCQAHSELKGFVKTLGVEGVMTVFFKPQAVGGVDYLGALPAPTGVASVTRQTRWQMTAVGPHSNAETRMPWRGPASSDTQETDRRH